MSAIFYVSCGRGIGGKNELFGVMKTLEDFGAKETFLLSCIYYSGKRHRDTHRNVVLVVVVVSAPYLLRLINKSGDGMPVRLLKNTRLMARKVGAFA